MKFLTVDNIISINRETIRLEGGSFFTADRNMLRPDSLEYLVEIVQTDWVKGLDENSLAVVAAYYVYFIVKDHIFHDGNKRTGMEAAFSFLLLNGCTLPEINIEAIVDTVMKVESNEIVKDGLIEWFKSIIT